MLTYKQLPFIVINCSAKRSNLYTVTEATNLKWRLTLHNVKIGFTERPIKLQVGLAQIYLLLVNKMVNFYWYKIEFIVASSLTVQVKGGVHIIPAPRVFANNP